MSMANRGFRAESGVGELAAFLGGYDRYGAGFVCGTCSSLVDLSKNDCPFCARSPDQGDQGQASCPGCGTSLPEGAKFCGSCGTRLGD